MARWRCDGVRLITSMMLLGDAVRARPNLTIHDETLVDAVILEGERATDIRLADCGIIGPEGERASGPGEEAWKSASTALWPPSRIT
jgi:choline dehydrogenase-like flavoprotein